MKHIINSILILSIIILNGCGEIDDSEKNELNNTKHESNTTLQQRESNDTKEESNTTHQQAELNITEENEPKVILKKGFIFEEIDCLNTSNLEAGREIECVSTITNEFDNEEKISIRYYLIDKKEKTSNILGIETFNAENGSSTYKSKFIIPTQLETDEYQILGFIFSSDLAKIVEKGEQLTEEEQKAYKKLFSKMDELITIQANDGKPDVELLSLSINNKKENSSKPSLLTFDIGFVKNQVILNNKELIFKGKLNLSSHIASAQNIKVDACIEINSDCEKIKFYNIDEDNKSIENEEFIVDIVELEKPKKITFNASVNKELLTKISKEVLNDDTTLVKLKIKIYGIEQSATENKDKNHIEHTLKFAPIILTQSTIDNNNDLVARVLPNFKLKTRDLLEKLYESNKDINPKQPTYIEPRVQENIEESTTDNNVVRVDGGVVQSIYSNITPITPPKKILPVMTSSLIIKSIPQKNILTPHVVSNEDISAISLGDLVNTPINKINLDDYDYSNFPLDAEKVFAESFGFEASNKYFGVDMGLGGEAKINKKGVQGTGKGEVNIKLFTYDINLFEINAYAGIKPESFDNTGYNFKVDIVGLTPYTKSQYLSDIDETFKSDANDITSDANNTGKKIKENKKKVDKYLQRETRETLFSYNENFSTSKMIEKSKTFFIGPVPVEVGAKAVAKIGIVFDTSISGINSLEFTSTPYGELEVGAHGGVGNSNIFSAGVQGSFILFNESLVSKVTASLNFMENETSSEIVAMTGTLNETITNVLKGPNGKIDLYATYPYPKICYTSWGHIPYPCGKMITSSINLASFSSKTYTEVLLDKEQSLFKVRLRP